MLLFTDVWSFEQPRFQFVIKIEILTLLFLSRIPLLSIFLSLNIFPTQFIL